jgi:glyoxylase-like metal-dependent hydrolase (beta-lactamase superfamily II)
VTHGHPDHLPAAYSVRARTDAAIFGHPAIHEVDVPLHSGDDVEGVSGEIIAQATPGHAADHLCFWLPTRRLLFAGDLVAGQGTVVLSQESGALALYLDSLRRMLALGPSTILPGHGPVIADGPAKLQEYLDHRALRERQILDVLRRGPATVDEIVQRLYAGTTAASLLPMAARNVQIHLDHLAHQGRAVEAGGRWHLREIPTQGMVE